MWDCQRATTPDDDLPFFDWSFRRWDDSMKTRTKKNNSPEMRWDVMWVFDVILYYAALNLVASQR